MGVVGFVEKDLVPFGADDGSGGLTVAVPFQLATLAEAWSISGYSASQCRSASRCRSTSGSGGANG